LSTANNFFFAFFHFRGETNRNRWKVGFEWGSQVIIEVPSGSRS
jgi:hypothetical protein